MTIKEVSERYNISADTLRYYERVGAIPPVTRSSSGIRSYSESDLGWVELAICMRSAGLPIEALSEYVKLFQQGESTVLERLELLKKQREELYNQKSRINETIDRLNYKISKYEEALNSSEAEWFVSSPFNKQ
ncbi:MAG: MerR family transcriptional regulator [Ruminococcus sp.]|nr:MerR family transcriptional regulator [Ruminococcus sp.]